MSKTKFTSEDYGTARQEFLHRMRTPLIAFVVLMALLSTNVVLGALLPFPNTWIVVGCVALAMVIIVLLFSMEVIDEPPLIRVASITSFFYLFLFFALVMVDYVSR